MTDAARPHVVQPPPRRPPPRRRGGAAGLAGGATSGPSGSRGPGAMVKGAMPDRWRLPGRAALVAGLAVVALSATPAPARSEDHPESADTLRSSEHPRGSSPSPGAGLSIDVALSPSSSRRDIPWDRLAGADYQLVREVVTGAAASREVREISFRSRKPVFEFLLDHLDFAADVARILRQGKYRVRRAGDAYEADDGHGTSGTLKPVFADGGRRVFYLAGRYDAPLVPTLAVRGVLLLDAEHLEGPDGVTYCALTVAGHVRFDSPVADTLARVARSYSEAQLDRQLRRFFRHVAIVSRRAHDDPESLAEELSQRPELPAHRVAQFRDVLLGHLPPPWSETQRYRLVEPFPPSPTQQ